MPVPGSRHMPVEWADLEPGRAAAHHRVRSSRIRNVISERRRSRRWRQSSVRKPDPEKIPAHIRDGAPCQWPPKRTRSQGTRKEQTRGHRTALDEPDAPLSCSKRHRPCSMTRQCTVVPRSGRRGRRFKSCHPDRYSRRPEARTRNGEGLSCCAGPSKGTLRGRQGMARERQGRVRRAAEHRPPSTM